RTSGETLAYIAINGQLAGVIQLQAVIRSEASDMVHSLQQRGLEVAIISGDRQQPTQQLAEQLGITTWFAEILPADKADIIQSYQQQGKSVCYIGDGMNDAIALKQANVSISLQGAAQVATDIAQILLLQKNLGQIVQSMVLAEQYKKTIQQTQVITTIPGVITVLGACFYGLSVTQSVMLNGLSLSLGAANTFRAGNQTRTRILKQKNQPRITR
ncbi:MAG: HAD-IC family P-type ATPase, partial [Pseudomonadota bacterium]